MFNNKSVRNIVFIALALGVLIPLINIYFIFPAFENLLIKYTEEDAVRTTKHLTSMFKQDHSALTQNSIPPDLKKKINMLRNDFQFLNFSILSRDGTAIYSTNAGDIGKTIDSISFREIVAKGNPYSKAVKKGSLSHDGKAATTDVVETYVPIMDDNTFAGAYQIVYSITQRNLLMSAIVLKAGIIPFLMMIGGLILTVIILIKLDKSITKLKIAEEELKSYAGKLQHSNRELEHFAHVASHDLQEPLRKVMAFGDRLKYRYEEALDDRGRDYLARMQSASQRMQTLINSLLMYSRVATKAQPFEPVDLNQMTKEVISDLEVRISETKSHIEIGELATVFADPLQMRQLMQNLISNALKFSREDAPPVVKINGEIIHGNGNNTSPGLFQFTVEDNGIGFEEKYAERIFDVFQRLHGKQEYEGAGIGLSICQRIVDRHNGKIQVKSSPGEGASFTVTLPVTQKNGGNNEY